MLTTTLKEIKKHKPCKGGWKKLLNGLGYSSYYKLSKEQKEKPINLKFILENNGVNDTFWVIEKTQSKKINMLLGVDIAESVLHIFEEQHPGNSMVRNCIRGIRDYCNGKITKKDLEELKNEAFNDVSFASIVASYVCAAANASYASFADSVVYAAYAAYAASSCISGASYIVSTARAAFLANSYADQWKTNEKILRKYL